VEGLASAFHEYVRSGLNLFEKWPLVLVYSRGLLDHDNLDKGRLSAEQSSLVEAVTTTGTVVVTSMMSVMFAMVVVTMMWMMSFVMVTMVILLLFLARFILTWSYLFSRVHRVWPKRLLLPILFLLNRLWCIFLADDLSQLKPLPIDNCDFDHLGMATVVFWLGCNGSEEVGGRQ
jgi:hypothetical protein